MSQVHVCVKDVKKLIDTPNNLFNQDFTRVAIYDMPESVMAFYEQHKSSVSGEVVVVRSRDDESIAAAKRNHGENILFVFSSTYKPSSYFTSVCKEYVVPYALVKRVNGGNAW
jgi:hypothetical protein